jgi:hypothetical protein
MSSCINNGLALGITSAANVAYQTDPKNNAGCKQQPKQSMEAFIEQKAKVEDQIDYAFIQKVIQELTQSCALQLPIPAAAIPPLIIQAAQYFWQNCDEAIEERYYCVKNQDFQRCGPNLTVKLPPQIVSVIGVNKLTDSIKYGVMGDFSLERMLLNNSALASGAGGTLSDVFGSGNGYTLTDVTAALYEVYTFNSMFNVPLTYNYNQFSNELVILGDLEYSDIILQTFKRLKIQDLYKNYYFFRLVVAFALRSMGTIMGTMEFKLPGGVTINYSRFQEMAETYIEEVKEWVVKNHAADYFINSSSL